MYSNGQACVLCPAGSSEADHDGIADLLPLPGPLYIPQTARVLSRLLRELYRPPGVRAVNKDGKIHIADYSNGRIQVF